jgi:hypothetical protein
MRNRALEITADALGFHPVEQRQDQHRQRHREGHVDVRCRHRAEVRGAGRCRGGRDQIHRQHVHEIHEQDPEEDRQRQRTQELAAAVPCVFHLAVDEFERKFDERLSLAWHTGRSASRKPPEPEEEEETQHERHDQGVDMERRQAAGRRQRRFPERQVMLDVIGEGFTAGFGTHSFILDRRAARRALQARSVFSV